MFQVDREAHATKADLYADLLSQLDSLVGDERDALANLANASALLHDLLPDLNWVGFYLHRGDGLLLGPFQGRVACVRIALGRGVCGTAAIQRQTVVVPDVHAFPGHIACDAASRSELVVPLLADGAVRNGGAALLGVLDLDSPLLARFDKDDARGLEAVAALLVARSDWQRVVGE